MKWHLTLHDERGRVFAEFKVSSLRVAQYIAHAFVNNPKALPHWTAGRIAA